MDDRFYIKLQENLISYFHSKGYASLLKESNDIDNFIIDFIIEDDIKKDLIILDIQTDKDRERFVLSFLTRRKIKIIESFFSDDYLMKMEDTRSENYTINLSSGFLENKRLHYTKEIEKDIILFEERIFIYIESTILPSLNKYQTLKELNSVVNKDLETNKLLWATNYWYYKMVIAWLSREFEFYTKLYNHIISLNNECALNEKDINEKQYYLNCISIAEQLHKDLEKINPNENYVIA